MKELSYLEHVLFDKFYQEGLKLAPNALKNLAENQQKPPEPVMSQDDYEKLNPIRKCILTCNMPGCGKVVSTHGMLCVEHTLQAQNHKV